jgi:hypothetical protein
VGKRALAPPAMGKRAVAPLPTGNSCSHRALALRKETRMGIRGSRILGYRPPAVGIPAPQRWLDLRKKHSTTWPHGGRALDGVLDLRKKRYGGGSVGPIPLNTEGLGSI